MEPVTDLEFFSSRPSQRDLPTDVYSLFLLSISSLFLSLPIPLFLPPHPVLLLSSFQSFPTLHVVKRSPNPTAESVKRCKPRPAEVRGGYRVARAFVCVFYISCIISVML